MGSPQWAHSQGTVGPLGIAAVSATNVGSDASASLAAVFLVADDRHKPVLDILRRHLRVYETSARNGARQVPSARCLRELPVGSPPPNRPPSRTGTGRPGALPYPAGQGVAASDCGERASNGSDSEGRNAAESLGKIEEIGGVLGIVEKRSVDFPNPRLAAPPARPLPIIRGSFFIYAHVTTFAVCPPGRASLCR